MVEKSSPINAIWFDYTKYREECIRHQVEIKVIVEMMMMMMMMMSVEFDAMNRERH